MQFNNGLVLQIIISFSALLPFLFMGLARGWTSVYFPTLENGIPIKIDTWEKAAILACGPIGSVIGTLSASLLTNIGRKYKIIAVTICYIIGSLLMSFPKSSVLLCLAQSIVGMGDGVTAIIVPLYIGEMVHHKIRGMIAMGWFLLLNTGFLLTNTLGAYLELSQFGYLQAAIALLCFSTTIWIPESPYFLFFTKRNDKAVKVLERITRKDNIDNKIDQIKTAITQQQENDQTLIQKLRQKSNKRSLFILVLVVNGKFCSGSYCINAFSQSIFKTMYDIISPVTGTVIFYTTKIISSLLCMVLIDKLGRRIALITSYAIAGGTLMIIAIYLYIKTNNILEISDLYQYILLIVLVLHTIVLSVLSGLPEVILGELLPMNMKSFGSLFFGILVSASSGIQTEMFQFILDYCEMSLSFIILSVLCFVHCILTYFYIFETKGKTLEEIQEYLDPTYSQKSVAKD